MCVMADRITRERADGNTGRTKAFRAREASRVTWVGLILNFMLVLLKFATGTLGHSGAMIADAVHSLSDLGSDMAVLIGFRSIGKPVDHDHDFGHGKFETFVTLVVGVFLFVAALYIIANSGVSLAMSVQGVEPRTPGVIAVVAALLSVLSKEWMYHYTIRTARRIGSKAIAANAWHHRSDALSSVATLIGTGGAVLLGGRFAVLDPVAAMVVGVLVAIVAIGFIKKSVHELLEGSLSSDEKDRILKIASSVEGIRTPHNLRTRQIGNSVAIDLHVCLDAEMTVREAHVIVRRVEDLLMQEFGKDSYVIVHADPADRCMD